MKGSKRTSEKYISIEIQQSTFQQLKDLAGVDLPPEKYLDNIINQMSTGIPLEHLKSASKAMQTSLTEIVEKLAAIADSLQRLTEITLENRRAKETLQGSFTPLPPGQQETSGPGFMRQNKHGETQNHFYDNQAFPLSPPANVFDDAGGEEASSLAANIKKYEEENPW
jgi:hypothetical protein